MILWIGLVVWVGMGALRARLDEGLQRGCSDLRRLVLVLVLRQLVGLVGTVDMAVQVDTVARVDMAGLPRRVEQVGKVLVPDTSGQEHTCLQQVPAVPVVEHTDSAVSVAFAEIAEVVRGP